MTKQSFGFVFVHGERNLPYFVQFAIHNFPCVGPTRSVTAGKKNARRRSLDDPLYEILRGRSSTTPGCVGTRNPIRTASSTISRTPSVKISFAISESKV